MRDKLSESEMTSAQAIVACLKKESVEKVFCVPGESYLALLDAIYEEPEIEIISARHEGGAAFMAEGYAKASLTTGVVLATRGVGGANLSIGVHTAFQDSTPMVVMLGQVHSEYRGREGFQEIDLDQYFQHISKWAVEIKDAHRTPEIIQRAFRIAKSGRPGPVVISLPEDVLRKVAKMNVGPVSRIPKPAPTIEDVEEVEAYLEKAKHPLIIAGGGIKLSRAEAALIDFAETNELPVITAFRRQDSFPNHHRLYAGHLGLGASEAVLKTVKESDAIIAIGTRLSEVTTQDYQIITSEKKLIHIDIDFMTLGKVYAPHVGIVSDAKEALKAFKKIKINPEKWINWAKEKGSSNKLASELKLSAIDPINKHVIASLIEKLPNNAIITNDAGNFAGWLHTFYPFNEKNTYVGPTSGAMGYGMPAALGVKLACPEMQVVALSGDGGFMMTAQELETAVRYNIRVIAIVFNNNMYGTIRMHQEMHYPNRVIGTDLGRVAFDKLAESMGAKGYSVETKEGFNQVLDEALKEARPTLIEVITNKKQISVSATINQIQENREK